MKVSDVMSKKVLSASPDDTLGSVIGKLSGRNITGMPVVHQGKVVGIITQTDILRNMDLFSGVNDFSDMVSIKKMMKGKDVSGDRVKKLHSRKVKHFMNKKVITIGDNNALSDAVKMINENDIDRLPVVHGKKLIGILTKKDVMKAVAKMNA